jgi:hypothetical protein
MRFYKTTRWFVVYAEITRKRLLDRWMSYRFDGESHEVWFGGESHEVWFGGCYLAFCVDRSAIKRSR